jgi:hypothetical protein
VPIILEQDFTGFLNIQLPVIENLLYEPDAERFYPIQRMPDLFDQFSGTGRVAAENGPLYKYEYKKQYSKKNPSDVKPVWFTQ